MDEKREQVESDNPLSLAHQEAMDRFIVFWGEMASNWGINRTMAQIHAFLYASEAPHDTDEIMERLRISRGNANMNLRSLMNWNLVYRVHLEGSRKDFYTAEKDVWKITAQIIRERERREITPVKQQLEACRDTVTGRGEGRRKYEALDARERQFYDRMENLKELMEVFEGLSRALMPVVQERNGRMLKQLIEVAGTLKKGKST